MRTIAEQFKYWQEALDDFQKNVEKDLDEIRRYKSEVQQMKIDLIDHLEKGRYVERNAVRQQFQDYSPGNRHLSGRHRCRRFRCGKHCEPCRKHPPNRGRSGNGRTGECGKRNFRDCLASPECHHPKRKAG